MTRQDALQRTAALLGSPALQRLEAARVAVLGLGGVGGHATEALARSGVGHLTLVDKDVIEPSNLNRQLFAATSTLGMYKTDAATARLRDVAPWVQVKALRQEYYPGCDFDFAACDCVLDCVDDLRAKVDIILRCQTAGVPILSCMGTAKRLDPAQVTSMDIYQTSGDGLARRMRGLLRKAGVTAQTVVCSTEPPHASLEGQPGSLYSCAFVPAAAGLLLAALAVQKLCG